MLAPRAAYASAAAAGKADALRASSPGYVLFYIVFVSVLAGACASFSATGRITLSQMATLSLTWMFVPLLQVLVARLVLGRPVAPVLIGHAPWSIWIIAAAAMKGTLGYAAYWWMLLAAVVPLLLTIRIIHAYCIDVRGFPPRVAWRRTAIHQGITYLIAAIYLERAVSLIPRIQGWLS
jgi:hypothetical protein